MNIQKVNEIREAISFFEDVELVTLVNETELLLKNKNDNSVWKLTYSFEKEFLLNGEGAELVTEGEKPEEVLTPKTFAKGFFGTEYSIDEMRAKLMEVDFKKSPIVEQKNILKVEDETDSIRETLNEDEKVAVDEFLEKYTEKLETGRQLVNTFIEDVAFVFENSGAPKSKTFLNPKKILDVYAEKVKLKELLVEGAQVFKNFSNEVTSLLEENEIDIKLAEALLEGFDPSADMSTVFTKNVLKIKKDNKLDISITETVKQLKAIQKEIFSEFDSSKSLNSIKSYNEGAIADWQSSYGPKVENFTYLKFGANNFSREGVRTLLEDFNAVMARFNSLTMEELQEISMMKDIVEYMFRTGNIDDEVITNIIDTFNNKFGKKIEAKA
jgi:hypothetical protein